MGTQNNSFSEFSESILRKWWIIENTESPYDMVDRITEWLKEIDRSFSDSEENSDNHIQDIKRYIGTKMIVPNTTIMTNLWRHNSKPLSACTVPDIDMRSDLSLLKAKIDDIHLSWMWTWFDFTWLDNPIKLLHFLNNAGVSLEESWKQERPVGNMWIMSIYDEHIIEFINVKRWADNRWEKWNFNISVSIDDNFMNSVQKNENITLSNWEEINANDLFNIIAISVHECADPWILFMDRMQDWNTTPSVWEYVSVAPCWETWLTKWETCNFWSLNLSEFINSNNEIDYKELEKATISLVRYLDNIVEYNLDKYSDESSRSVMEQKRKIWVGVCWIADMFFKLQTSYGSEESIKLSENIMSFINFTSKKASMELAKERWSFWAFKDSLYQTNYLVNTFWK